MLHLTLHVPHDLADDVASILVADAYATDVVRHVGVCERPAGDALSCLVPREAVVVLLDDLAAAGFDDSVGTILLDERLTVLSQAAADAERRAAGAPGDALVWPIVRSATAQACEFSFSYFAFMVLATALAAVGLLTASSVLIVGAMILGPEFGALAHICVSAIGRDRGGLLTATVLLVSGFAVAIASSAALVALLDLVDLASVTEFAGDFERTIVSPTWLGLVVAIIAGTAGVLTLTSSKGEALIGVLVSVTTIPAAADMSIGIAFTDGSRVVDGAATLLINLGGMVVAGAVTLVVHRSVTRRGHAAVALALAAEANVTDPAA